jgi:hypothetical protein
MNTWKQGDIYDPGAVVGHQGQAYRKLDDGDNSPPDAVPGGWELLQNSNLQQYEVIEAALGSYEQRRDAHIAAVAAAKASAEAKLKALGLTVEELQALGL